MKKLFVCNPKEIDKGEINYFILPERWMQWATHKSGEFCIIDTDYSQEEYEEMHAYIFELRKRIVQNLTHQYNMVFDCAFTYEQLDFLLGRLVSEVAFLTYSKFDKIAKIQDRRNICFYKTNFSTPRKYKSFDLQNEDLNAYIYGEICSFYGFEELEDVIDTSRRSSSGKKRRNLLGILKKLGKISAWKRYAWRVINILHDYFGVHCGAGRLFNRRIECVSICIRTFFPQDILDDYKRKSKGKIVQLHEEYYGLLYDPVPQKTKKDSYLRQKLFENYVGDSDFEVLLKEILQNLLPMEMVECFKRNLKEAYKLYKLYYPQKIYAALYFPHYAIVLSIFAALKRKDGVKLIDIQHSSVYMSNRFMSYYEAQTFDRFVTSGWISKVKYGKFVNIAEVRNIKGIKELTKRKSIKKILLIPGIPEKYDTGRGMCAYDYYERHFEFLANLDESILKLLTVRMREDIFDMCKEYKEKYPEVSVHLSSDVDFYTDLGNTDLIICDYQSSPYIQALMMNIPTMLYDGILYKSVNEQMNLLLDEMRTMHLYSRDGKGLANMLNENIENICEIWYSETCQDFITYMLDSLTKIHSNPKELWYNELISLC